MPIFQHLGTEHPGPQCEKETFYYWYKRWISASLRFCFKKKIWGKNFSPGLFSSLCQHTLLHCFLEGIRQDTTSMGLTLLCPPKTTFPSLHLSPVMSCCFGKRYIVYCNERFEGLTLEMIFVCFEHKPQLTKNNARKGQRCVTCAAYGSEMSKWAYGWGKSCANGSQLSLRNLIFRAQSTNSQSDRSAVQEREQVLIWHSYIQLF